MRVARRIVPGMLLIAVLVSSAAAQPREVSKVKEAELGRTPNVHTCGSLFLAGQPGKDDIATIKDKGIKRVITLRTDGEIDWDEAAMIKDAGLEFVKIAFREPDTLTDEVFDKVRKLLNDKEKTPTLLHCGSANRVGAVWLVHRVLDEGVPLEKAVEEAKTVGLRSEAYLEKARDYIQRRDDAQSVRPGINDSFLKADLNIEEWLGRFEVESREIFAARREIVNATGIRAGDRVADIGAGTGFFSRLFAEVVGDEGWVYAVDISPGFLEHIVQQSQRDGVRNLTAVLAPQKSINLPAASIDVAFVCDTYHHFEYPRSTLTSIQRALKPGGRLIVIDFERIPGKSREFVLNHVRAGKEVFRKEIEAAGFTFVEERKVEGLQENYFIQFRSNEEK